MSSNHPALGGVGSRSRCDAEPPLERKPTSERDSGNAVPGTAVEQENLPGGGGAATAAAAVAASSPRPLSERAGGGLPAAPGSTAAAAAPPPAPPSPPPVEVVEVTALPIPSGGGLKGLEAAADPVDGKDGQEEVNLSRDPTAEHAEPGAGDGEEGEGVEASLVRQGRGLEGVGAVVGNGQERVPNTSEGDAVELMLVDDVRRQADDVKTEEDALHQESRLEEGNRKMQRQEQHQQQQQQQEENLGGGKEAEQFPGRADVEPPAVGAAASGVARAWTGGDVLPASLFPPEGDAARTMASATMAAEQGVGETGAEGAEQRGEEEEEMLVMLSAEDLNKKFKQVVVRAGEKVG